MVKYDFEKSLNKQNKQILKIKKKLKDYKFKPNEVISLEN